MRRACSSIASPGHRFGAGHRRPTCRPTVAGTPLPSASLACSSALPARPPISRRRRGQTAPTFGCIPPSSRLPRAAPPPSAALCCCWGARARRSWRGGSRRRARRRWACPPLLWRTRRRTRTERSSRRCGRGRAGQTRPTATEGGRGPTLTTLPALWRRRLGRSWRPREGRKGTGEVSESCRPAPSVRARACVSVSCENHRVCVSGRQSLLSSLFGFAPPRAPRSLRRRGRG